MAAILIVLAIVIAVGLFSNMRAARRAETGTEFTVSASPMVVSTIVADAYSPAALRNMFRLAQLDQPAKTGENSFRHSWRTETGDRGYIDVSAHPNGSKVTARATDLHVGMKKSPSGGAQQYLSGTFAIVLRLRPNARRIARFCAGVEKTVTKQLAKRGR